jgi:hypothetical protein
MKTRRRTTTVARSTLLMFETVAPMFWKMIIEENPDMANCYEKAVSEA